MQISSETIDNVTVVRLEGNLDTNTSSEAHDYVNKAIDDGAAKVVVSLDKVDFVSSAGLRILLATGKRLSGTGGRIAGGVGYSLVVFLVLWFAVLPVIDPVMLELNGLVFSIAHMMWGAVLGLIVGRAQEAGP